MNLVRSFVPGHQIAESGGWHIADCVSRAYDVEGMQVGTVGAGRIGLAVLKRWACLKIASLKIAIWVCLKTVPPKK